jgi:threonine dehydratase
MFGRPPSPSHPVSTTPSTSTHTMPNPLSLDTIRDAQRRIVEHVVRTPMLTSERLNQSTGLDITFKCENLQHVGAFKARGACNAVFSLTPVEAGKGVVTHSSGNHAAALARAASIRGIRAHVVMPGNSKVNKIAAVRRFGVEPTFCDPDATSRQQTADRIADETGATFIHPYDDVQVIAGQGTVGLEIHEQLADFDVVVIPVGGGGLLAGCLTSLKSLRPDVKIIAAEPEWADDAFRSLKSGKIEQPTRYDTIGDGLRTPLGKLTFPIIQELADDILLATEQQIVAATRQIIEETKTIVEPSSAVPLASVLANASRFQDQRVVIVLSGGNLDVSTFSLA